jgi:ubiquinone/menaquinone biosynthesis C-methylase UbiE
MTDPSSRSESYVPALGVRWLTPLYDPIVRLFFDEEKLRRLLVNQVGLRPGQRILDLGCGTATLTLMLKRACPDATVVGLDADPEILKIAKRKVTAAGLEVELHQGLASAPPFNMGSFDRVVSSLVFHHLTTEEKRKTFAKIRELLKPGGELHAADWGKPQNLLMRVAFLSVQMLDGFSRTSDNAGGRLIPLMEEAGLDSVSETGQRMSPLGTLSLYRAVRQ